MDNDFSPIDSLRLLKELSLDILLYFQENDEILSNRDDHLYIERLKENQPDSQITVLIGDDGGQITPHLSLWQCYSQKIREKDHL